ncbi:hypothetical protein EDD36DRAFT_329598 [Exophiala viscosa]|uniref:J domain-containing protein n=1 Tax=Exophiala viscosa TaxID=2486360 RepID=A0AAN6DQ60_9EURO|nr:hypothetical protein EDD36DRAFT_329598 [Exophiala viscosa]
MASPLPPDPYQALGVSKDADVSAIRSAHRKLALKFHPDRIQDEALREKGKDEFQKIQQAYEILSDPVRRSRYDDRVRLAELRKEAMMREPPPPSSTRSYPMRPAPQPAPSSTREYRDDGNFFEEVRQPRNAAAYEYRDIYDEEPIPRPNARKNTDYERRPAPPPRPAEKSKKPSAAWERAMAGAKSKVQADKTKTSKADEKMTDREKRRDRRDKYRTYAESDSEVEIPEIRPKPSARSKTTSQFESSAEYARRSSPRTSKSRDYDEESVEEKWERHHQESKKYISKAANRPALERTGSDAYQYWNGEARGGGRRSDEDGERRPGSSKGRRTQAEDYFTPPFAKSTSSPSALNAHVEERAPRSSVGTTRERERERDRDRPRSRDRERDRDHRKGVPPNLRRAETTPILKVPKKDTAPAKGSNLKHGETHMHDSGYGSGPSPHTPETREKSPSRPSKTRYPSTTSTKYRVNPDMDDEDLSRTPRLNKINDDYGPSRYDRGLHRSPEAIKREPLPRESDRPRERPERPTLDSGRKQSSRGASLMQEFVPPPVRRSGSGRYEDVPSPRSPRDTPPVTRNNSGREKLFGEMSPDEREASRYSRPYSEDKVHITPRREPQYSNYSRDPAEYRESDYSPRMRDGHRTTRRPSAVSVGAY